MNQEVYRKMQESMNRIKEVDVSGIKLEDFDERVLFTDQLDIDTNLIIQPPAYGYYSRLLADADNEIRYAKDAYSRWFLCKMAEASAQLMGSDPDAYKPTESDKKARVYINCKQEALASGGKDEIEVWEDRIKELEQYRNMLKFWVDTLQTKNFLLPHYIARQTFEDNSVSTYKDKNLTPVERPLSTLKRNTLKSGFSRNS